MIEPAYAIVAGTRIEVDSIHLRPGRLAVTASLRGPSAISGHGWTLFTEDGQVVVHCNAHVTLPKLRRGDTMNLTLDLWFDSLAEPREGREMPVEVLA